jgi:hypothetical protein
MSIASLQAGVGEIHGFIVYRMGERRLIGVMRLDRFACCGSLHVSR